MNERPIGFVRHNGAGEIAFRQAGHPENDAMLDPEWQPVWFEIRTRVTDDQPTALESAFVAFTALADILNTLVSFAAGHREECLRAGFSETAAEQMAVNAHAFGLQLVAKAQT